VQGLIAQILTEGPPVKSDLERFVFRSFILFHLNQKF